MNARPLPGSVTKSFLVFSAVTVTVGVLELTFTTQPVLLMKYPLGAFVSFNVYIPDGILLKVRFPKAFVVPVATTCLFESRRLNVASGSAAPVALSTFLTLTTPIVGVTLTVLLVEDTPLKVIVALFGIILFV